MEAVLTYDPSRDTISVFCMYPLFTWWWKRLMLIITFATDLQYKRPATCPPWTTMVCLLALTRGGCTANTTMRAGLSDPYVIIRVLPEHKAIKPRQSNRLNETLNPVFNQTFELYVEICLAGKAEQVIRPVPVQQDDGYSRRGLHDAVRLLRLRLHWGPRLHW